MILCDLDNVLATSGGLDIGHGQPIHRTFLTPPPELEQIRLAGIPFHVLTKKPESEAWQVLRAIGLDRYVTSVVGATALFWPSVWHALSHRTLPTSISKTFFARTLSPSPEASVVMIEDRRENLHDMFDAGIIDIGILVPPIRVSDERVVEWFNLNIVLKIAKDLTKPAAHELDLSGNGLTVYRWRRGMPERIPTGTVGRLIRPGQYLVEVQTVPVADVASPLTLMRLATGQRLTAGRFGAIRALRIGRSMLQQLTTALHPRSIRDRVPLSRTGQGTASPCSSTPRSRVLAPKTQDSRVSEVCVTSARSDPSSKGPMPDASRTSWPLTLVSRLALSAVALLMALLLLEGGVRLLAPQNLDFYNGEKIMRASTRPGQPVEFIPNSSNDSYVGVPVRINSIGLRDRETAVPKPRGVFRVLAIGDSVTFGFGVRLQETYAKQLEARLNSRLNGAVTVAEVINAGIEGTGLDYYYHSLRTLGSRLEADLVLVGIVLNDIADYDDEHNGSNVFPPTRPSHLQRLNRFLRLHSHFYAYTYTPLKSLLYKSGLLDINSVYGHNFLTLGPPSERQEHAWRSSLRRLAEIVDTARGMKMPIALVVFPMEIQLSSDTRDLYRRALKIKLDDDAFLGTPQRRLADFARAHAVPLIDLLPRFRDAQAQGLFLRNHSISHDWVHPSPKGHDTAADEIFRALLRLRLLPQGSDEQPTNTVPERRK